MTLRRGLEDSVKNWVTAQAVVNTGRLVYRQDRNPHNSYPAERKPKYEEMQLLNLGHTGPECWSENGMSDYSHSPLLHDWIASEVPVELLGQELS